MDCKTSPAIADTIVETHDRIVGKTWREAKKRCDERIMDAKASVQDTLWAFFTLGTALLEARNDDAPLDKAVVISCGRDDLEKLVVGSAKLTDTMEANPLAHVVLGYHRFRRYAPRMLAVLAISGAPVATPLIAAAEIVRSGGFAPANEFPRTAFKMASTPEGPRCRRPSALGGRGAVPSARCLPLR